MKRRKLQIGCFCIIIQCKRSDRNSILPKWLYEAIMIPNDTVRAIDIAVQEDTKVTCINFVSLRSPTVDNAGSPRVVWFC